jgi:hypothetical protein
MTPARSLLRFRFASPSDATAVEDDLRLALFAAECLYGSARLRLEAAYLVRCDGATCVIESRGEAAEAAARVFAGLSAMRVGEAGFSVEHVAADPRAPVPTGAASGVNRPGQA